MDRYLVNENMQIEKLEKAMAFFKSTIPKKICKIVLAILLPPIPSTLLSNLIKLNRNVPTHSIGSSGHIDLCRKEIEKCAECPGLPGARV